MLAIILNTMNIIKKTTKTKLLDLSRRMVMTVSTVENWVPNPRERSIMKKRIDQRGDIGIRATASG